MNKFIYETMYILRPDMTEEKVEQAITKYKSMLEEQGAYDIKIQHRGKLRLAYEINNQREGIYIQMNYQGPPTQIAILERAMRLSEEVIRYLTVKQELPKTPETDTQKNLEPAVALAE
ncbi:SSU ribosomal protein S6P [Trichodesmium erythraeum IMS101]|uniref:Small ribosomal subunit protein bS6 n=1 Tax=Trichodesmium erythraeum (strain IMS101) TaxID=203124 RepID=RS6_TRIEI|nr:RecName: Full=Small ribosomal subunit protein bS6; AltName: Full=30S ribosomal protein S6 [Trichodesmium erythraeum IMS101]MBS9773289.1 30S ribosomal protein S6 [Trichodesmium erythraeum GBRTRLIN201]MCH2049405.1 30S ribosomal protein S6 [Trichodesmium sp. ALOHA_ZT_67]MDE5095618.1 30S ribosomal protein S6 [Trichodesmium sp. St11_bin5]MDT9338131.1 30S ribosomal protein S6 [Trichodesmium erythraeum 21-75]